jgi:hypothetical protein
MIKPSKEGQIVKFHTPLPDEDPNQLYVVLEVKLDTERPRVDIMALGTGLGDFNPINTVSLDDLMAVEVNTSDLIGHKVVIDMPDHSQVEGRVKSVADQKVQLDLTKGAEGVETNVKLTIVDKEGKEHTGTLYVGKP